MALTEQLIKVPMSHLTGCIIQGIGEGEICQKEVCSTMRFRVFSPSHVDIIETGLYSDYLPSYSVMLSRDLSQEATQTNSISAVWLFIERFPQWGRMLTFVFRVVVEQRLQSNLQKKSQHGLSSLEHECDQGIHCQLKVE